MDDNHNMSNDLRFEQEDKREDEDTMFGGSSIVDELSEYLTPAMTLSPSPQPSEDSERIPSASTTISEPPSPTPTPPLPASPVNRGDFDKSRTFSLKSSGSRVKIVNGVTFPDSPTAVLHQQKLKPASVSYCDYFWADVDEHTSGFDVLIQYHHHGKQMTKEMAEFFKERAALEDFYARGLQKLSESHFGDEEEGTLGESWKSLKHSYAQESQLHKAFANDVMKDVEKTLSSHRDQYKKEIKKMQSKVQSERKQLLSKYNNVGKAKQNLAEKLRDFESKKWAKNNRHEQEFADKAKRKSTMAGDELEKAMLQYNMEQDKWFEDTISLSLDLEQYDSDRVALVQTQLNKYLTLVDGLKLKLDTVHAIITDSVSKVNADVDRELFVKQRATGELRPTVLTSVLN